MRQLLDVGKYMSSQLLPFSWRYSVSDMARTDPRLGGHARRYSTAQSAAAFIGITPAPVDIEKPSYERVIDRMWQQNLRQGARTHADVARADRKLEMERQIRLGNEKEAARIEQEGLKRGEITADDMGSARERSTVSPAVRKFKALKLEDALTAFQYVVKDAPKDERAKMHDILINKMLNKWGDIMAKSDDDPERVRVMRMLRHLNLLTEEGDINTEAPPE
jgi:hypothetical protein